MVQKSSFVQLKVAACCEQVVGGWVFATLCDLKWLLQICALIVALRSYSSHRLQKHFLVPDALHLKNIFQLARSSRNHLTPDTRDVLALRSRCGACSAATNASGVLLVSSLSHQQNPSIDRCKKGLLCRRRGPTLGGPSLPTPGWRDSPYQIPMQAWRDGWETPEPPGSASFI